jgi:hypothetical protein
MRFITMIRMDENGDFGPTPPAVYEAMAGFEREGRANGTLVELGGLLPSAAGAIVSLANGSIKAVDGPFAEAKELVGGYGIVEVRSREEAVEIGRRLMQVHLEHWPGWSGSCEIRQIAGL